MSDYYSHEISVSGCLREMALSRMESPTLDRNTPVQQMNIQLMHSFEVNIRMCQPENITFEG